MDIQIPREAVDKAARSLFNHEYTGDFDTLALVDQHILREKAVGALNAAAPAIVAAFLEGPFADALKQRADRRAQVGDDDHDENGREEEGYDCHTAAAVATWLRASTMAKAQAIHLRGGAS